MCRDSGYDPVGLSRWWLYGDCFRSKGMREASGECGERIFRPGIGERRSGEQAGGGERGTAEGCETVKGAHEREGRRERNQGVGRRSLRVN